jgi:hypothetical protein
MDQLSIKTPNAKFGFSKKFTCQDTWRHAAAGFYLSEAPIPSFPPPAIKQCLNTYLCTYPYREGGDVGEPVRRLEGR